MTALNLKGTHITKFDANPPDIVNAREHGGVVKYVGDGLDVPILPLNSVVILAKLPADARVLSLKFASTDLGTTGEIDIGIYRKTREGAYAVAHTGSEDAFAEDVDVNAAAVALTEYRFSALANDTLNKPLWALAGLSARPEYNDMYIGISVPEVTTAAGKVAIQVLYTE